MNKKEIHVETELTEVIDRQEPQCKRGTDSRIVAL